MGLIGSRFVRRRLLFFIPQLLLVTVITFSLIEFLPGDPTDILVGPLALPEDRQRLRESLGLDDPVVDRYFRYVGNVVTGDLGYSWYNSQAVTRIVGERLPRTLELITITLLVALIIMIPLGARAATLRRTGKAAIADKAIGKVIQVYGLLAGSLADFWVALILIFVFYASLGWSPLPNGAFGLGVDKPPNVTGFLTIDTVISGNGAALKSYLGHLVLPVATLVFVYGGGILKITIASMAEIKNSLYLENAQAMGLKSNTLRSIQFRNALPPVLTMIGMVYGFLLGGAVLVEAIFGLNGFGKFGVDSVLQSDFIAAQSFVLIAAVWVMLVYLIVDLLLAWTDPRLRL